MFSVRQNWSRTQRRRPLRKPGIFSELARREGLCTSTYLAVAGEELGAAEKGEDLVVPFLHHENLASHGDRTHAARFDMKKKARDNL